MAQSGDAPGLLLFVFDSAKIIYNIITKQII